MTYQETTMPADHRTGANARTKTVLIVEDNELNMKLFHDLLDVNGYATVQTRNGLEVLDLARAHRPDLILMDINMPEMDGLTATTELRRYRNLDHIPIVALTANLMHDVLEQALKAGCNGYIEKPIKVDELPSQIMCYLHKQ